MRALQNGKKATVSTGRDRNPRDARNCEILSIAAVTAADTAMVSDGSNREDAG
jgi:hypothetical protein